MSMLLNANESAGTSADSVRCSLAGNDSLRDVEWLELYVGVPDVECVNLHVWGLIHKKILGKILSLS